MPSCPLLDYLGGLFPRARKSANKFQADLPDQQNYEKPILQEDHRAQSRKNNRRKAFGKLFFPACKKFSERNVLSLYVSQNELGLTIWIDTALHFICKIVSLLCEPNADTASFRHVIYYRRLANMKLTFFSRPFARRFAETRCRCGKIFVAPFRFVVIGSHRTDNEPHSVSTFARRLCSGGETITSAS